MDVNNGNSSGRRSITYHPTVWGDHFLAYDSKLTEIDPSEEREVQELKEEVRKLVISAPPASSEKLELIDQTQRLGVAYHFEDEIEESIRHIFDNYDEYCNKGEDKNNLHVDALRFRLLRQEGHYISCGVFEKYLDKDGKFKDALKKDVEGMLSLYEAAYLGVHGETTLDEALTFTTTQLKSMFPDLNKLAAAKVTHALKFPIRRTLARVGARDYIPIYQDDENHNKVLLRFAKLDFNLLQKVHQRELSGITRWWKDFDVPKTLPFARDRLAECYFWILGIYFEPQYHFSRRVTTQIISLWSILDDLYDNYGTQDELQLFTNAIQRWDTSASNEVPPYLKKLYLSIIAISIEIKEVIAKENKQFHVSYAIGEMKKEIRAYHEEFMWFNTKHVPTFEEYMKVALVTSCYMMLATTSLMGMDMGRGDYNNNVVTKEVLDWITSEPLAVKATCTICRLMDDMIGHEFEQERGHVASAVECYMKEYGVSKQEAYTEIEKLISKAWKDMNQECLNPTPVPMKILLRVMNLARAIYLLYKDKDIYTFSQVKLKAFITTVLVQPLTI